MSYSLWSRGRLLGTSELDFMRCMARHRTGFLLPTPVGEQILPEACGVSPAFMAISRRVKDVPGDDAIPLDALRDTTEYADLMAAQDRCAALELELRRADGSVVPTEWIDVKDGEFLLAMAREAEEEMEGHPDALLDVQDDMLESAHDEGLDFLDEPTEMPQGGWEEPDGEEDDDAMAWPRYQLHVKLLDDADIP